MPSLSRNILLVIAFDGTAYYGWQRQKSAPTIQGVLEEKLSSLCNTPIKLHGAGRTDTGVHALGMVAHFQTSVSHKLSAFSRGLNSMLPKDIRIIEAREAASDFHSRFSALGKTYRYDFFIGSLMLPTLRLYKAHFPGTFNISSVNACISHLIGTHDFASFEGSGSRDLSLPGGRGSVRTILHAHCTATTKHNYSFFITGDGFLRHMVRNIVGTLLLAGKNKISSEDFNNILSQRDRRTAGQTAPACGLFLEQIYYEKSELSSLSVENNRRG
jgi:tRNA pseudouridine38-40 synthase